MFKSFPPLALARCSRVTSHDSLKRIKSRLQGRPQGLHIGKREDPEDEVGMRSYVTHFGLPMNAMDHNKIPPPIPDKLQKLIFAFRESQALFAAYELGIFDLLHDSKTLLSAEDIAAKIKADSDATARLMDTLVALELLEKTQGDATSWLYSNTKIASQFLTKSSPDSVGGYITHSTKLVYPLFGNLQSAVREGSSQWMNTFGMSSDDVWKSSYHNEEARLRFLGAMHSTSRHTCHAVATAFDLSNFRSCCDLGGR